MWEIQKILANRIYLFNFLNNFNKKAQILPIHLYEGSLKQKQVLTLCKTRQVRVNPLCKALHFFCIYLGFNSCKMRLYQSLVYRPRITTKMQNCVNI